MKMKTPYDILREAGWLLKLLNEILVGDALLKSPVPDEAVTEMRDLEDLISGPGFATSTELTRCFTIWGSDLEDTLSYYGEHPKSALLQVRLINHAPLVSPIIGFQAEDFWRTDEGQILAHQMQNDIESKLEIFKKALEIEPKMKSRLRDRYSRPIDQIIEFRRKERALYYLDRPIHQFKKGTILEIFQLLPKKTHKIPKNAEAVKKTIREWKKKFKRKLKSEGVHEALIADSLFTSNRDLITLSSAFVLSPYSEE